LPRQSVIKEELIGVLSVLKPIDSLEGYLLTETKQLQNYAFVLLGLALVLGCLLSQWFTHFLNKLAKYANSMAEGKKVMPPLMRGTPSKTIRLDLTLFTFNLICTIYMLRIGYKFRLIRTLFSFQ